MALPHLAPPSIIRPADTLLARRSWHSFTASCCTISSASDFLQVLAHGVVEQHDKTRTWITRWRSLPWAVARRVAAFEAWQCCAWAAWHDFVPTSCTALQLLLCHRVMIRVEALLSAMPTCRVALAGSCLHVVRRARSARSEPRAAQGEYASALPLLAGLQTGTSKAHTSAQSNELTDMSQGYSLAILRCTALSRSQNYGYILHVHTHTRTHTRTHARPPLCRLTLRFTRT